MAAQILLVGADNFPFPIPLKKNAAGQWFFDTAAGKDEILNRRIGRNELAIIDVCRAVADAQAQYFSQPHDGEQDETIRGEVHQRPRQAEWLVLEVGRRAARRARSARWRRSQPPKDIPQSPRDTPHSTATTSAC